jgi:hypothetical protein
MSPQSIAEAFALSNAKGAELLAQLGRFAVWEGDLAAMRGDNPRGGFSADSDAGSAGAAFQEAFILAKALELLTPECRSALAAVYADGRFGGRVPRDCEERLLQIYESLVPEYSASGRDRLR